MAETMMQVWARDENVIAHIRHPARPKTPFRSLVEPVDWPADAFTFRRLADGDVLDHAPAPATDASPAAPALAPQGDSFRRDDDGA